MLYVIRQSIVCSCLLLVLSGCVNLPSKKCADAGCNSSESCSQGCQDNQGCNDGCNKGCKNGCNNCDGPKRWSAEWYAIEADTPVGAPQKYKKGKMWPPFSRPNGKRQQCSHRYHAAHYWPHPYNCEDKNYVNQVIERQAHQGWTEETTLFDYHFDAETQELNHAGERHLQWIVEFTPVERRAIWIQKSIDPVINQQRLAHVQLQATTFTGTEDAPSVALRIAAPTGRPALEINAIRLAEIQSMPEPRVQYNALPSGSSAAP